MNIRPRRSVLYMPGSNSRALEKAAALPADALILDLEDAVAPEAKALARDQVIAAANAKQYGTREVIIRINGLDTEWGAADAEAVAASAAHAVLLPKVEIPNEINDLEARLEAFAARDDMAIWIMIETPRGVLNAERLVASSARLNTVVMGTSDLAKELRLDPDDTRAGLRHALSHCVLAARALGLDIIDGVHLALDDPDAFRTACAQGRKLGFDGKSLIHPRQIAPANEIFGVSEAAAADAATIVDAWQRVGDDGITVVNGRLVEQLHVDEAQRTLALMAAISELEGDS
ncbi:MAG: HpcH/HpaI aldolase/citrate lyase family protein [Gammaproteobacteria bacterium]